MPGGSERVKDRVAAAAQLDALVAGGQKAAAPEAVEQALVGIGAGAVRDHHDERRQVVGLGAQAVAEPGAERRPARLLRAGLDERDGRVVIDRLGVHRVDDADVIDDCGPCAATVR